MIEFIKEMFSYHFMVRAVVVGALVSLCAALLGVSLVLKRYSMIGDGLSHVGFGALAIAAAVNICTAVSCRSGRYRGGVPAAEDKSEQQDKGRRGYRADILVGAGNRRCDRIAHNGHEHRRFKLHVRQHSLT